MIDREYLEATWSNLKGQEREATEMVHQCKGALLLCEALLAKINEDEKADKVPVVDGGVI